MYIKQSIGIAVVKEFNVILLKVLTLEEI